MVGSITAVGYGLAAIGGGIGVGLIFAAYMTSVARPVSYTHLTLPTIHGSCRSRWSPYH